MTNAKPPGQALGWKTRTRSGDAYQWRTDFREALAIAGREQKNLFVFYYSAFSDESNSMEQMLSRVDVASLFTDTVNCALDWASGSNRELLTDYGVDRVPAFLMIRPDGTYHARAGKVDVADLSALITEAQEPGLRPVRRVTAAP
jgi:hypothetical protein